MAGKARHAGSKVLVVDDQVGQARMMCELLRESGYVAAYHTNPAEAILSLEKCNFDAVLVDLHMPEISGLEFLSVANQACSTSVFIIITAEGDMDSAVTALKAGAVDYLVKPFDVAKTTVVIDQALDGRNRERAQNQIERNTAAEASRLNQRLLLDKHAAEVASRAKSDFIAGLSHELRNSLNPIVGFSRILMNLNWDTSKDERERFLTSIYTSAKQMQSLLEDAGNIARIEAGSVRVQLDGVAIAKVVAECVNALEAEFHQNAIQVVNQVGDILVSADAVRLRQVMMNLLTNAVKYNKHGGYIELTTKRFETDIELIIKDSGIGMSPHQLERLFTPFDRLGMEHTGIQGVGLGLVLSKNLMEMMNGNLAVASTPGKGTELRLILPLCDPVTWCRKSAGGNA